MRGRGKTTARGRHLARWRQPWGRPDNGSPPCLPIEPLPFVGNLVRQRPLSLVVDGTDGDPAVPEAALLPAVPDQLVILVFGHRVDLVTILKLEAAVLDGIHHKFLQRGPNMELSRFRQT